MFESEESRNRGRDVFFEIKTKIHHISVNFYQVDTPPPLTHFFEITHQFLMCRPKKFLQFLD